jgi:hypothetical protein
MKENKVIREDCFTAFGQHEFLDSEKYPVTSDDTKWYAKCITTSEKEVKYFIMLNSAGDAFDPKKESPLVKNLDKQLYVPKYKRVTKDVFDLYKRFLKTLSGAVIADVNRRIM